MSQNHCLPIILKKLSRSFSPALQPGPLPAGVRPAEADLQPHVERDPPQGDAEEVRRQRGGHPEEL